MTFWNQRCSSRRGQHLHIRESYPVHRKRELPPLSRSSRGSAQLLGHSNLAPSKQTFKKSVIRRVHPAIWRTHSIWAWNILFHKSLFPAPPLQSHVQTIWTAHKAEDNFRAFPRAWMEAFQSFLSVKSDALFLYTCKKMKSVSIPFYLQNEMEKHQSLTQPCCRFLERKLPTLEEEWGGRGNRNTPKGESKSGLLTPEKPLCAWSHIHKHTWGWRAELRNKTTVISGFVLTAGCDVVLSSRPLQEQMLERPSVCVIFLSALSRRPSFS